MKKRVLVTGGAGFIGSFICERLIKDKRDTREIQERDKRYKRDTRKTQARETRERLVRETRERD